MLKAAWFVSFEAAGIDAFIMLSNLGCGARSSFASRPRCFFALKTRCICYPANSLFLLFIPESWAYDGLKADRRDAIRRRVSLAVFDAGGAAPMCHMLALAARILADTPGRRPRGRRMSEGMTEEAGLKNVVAGAELALGVLDFGLYGGRDDLAIAQEGLDAVARAVLDAGGPRAAMQFQVAASRVSDAIRSNHRLDYIGNGLVGNVLKELGLRPRAGAAIAEAASAQRDA